MMFFAWLGLIMVQGKRPYRSVLEPFHTESFKTNRMDFPFGFVKENGRRVASIRSPYRGICKAMLVCAFYAMLVKTNE